MKRSNDGKGTVTFDEMLLSRMNETRKERERCEYMEMKMLEMLEGNGRRITVKEGEYAFE